MKYEPVKEFHKSKLVLGEGIDEWCLFRALLRHLQADQFIDAEKYDGKTRIQEGLKGISKRPGFANINSLAVTRDADFISTSSAAVDVVAAAFESICDALDKAGLPKPSQPFVIEQTTFQDREFQIGAFIFPGPGRAGMLEDLCLEAAAADPASACVEMLWQCIAEKFPEGSRTHSQEAWPKARIHAWLATLPKPDLRLGEAALSGDIDFRHVAFDDFKQFLQQL